MSTTDRTPPRVRRVVTGHDGNGRAVVWLDGEAGNHKFPDARVSSTLMWSTDATPADILGAVDEGNRVLGTNPPPGGSRFTMMEFQPGNELHGLHRTDTVDYVICISGEMTMLLDDGVTVTLAPGDVLIQRGTNHAWSNRTEAPCCIAFVLIDAEPV